MHKEHILPRKISSFLLFFLKKQWFIFSLITLTATLANVATSTLWPSVTGQLVDAFSHMTNHNIAAAAALQNPVFSAFIVWVVIELLQRSKGVLLAFAAPDFNANIRNYLLKFVLRHPHAYFVKKYATAVAYRIDSMPKSANLIIEDLLIVFIPLLVAALISVGVFWTLHWLLALVFLSWLVLHIAFSVGFCKKASKFSFDQYKARTLVQTNISDLIRNHFNIRIFNTYAEEATRAENLQNKENRKYFKTILYIEKGKLILSVLGIIATSILLYTTIQLWLSQQISTGDIIYVLNSVINIMSIMWFASDEIPHVFHEIGVCSQGLELVHWEEVPLEDLDLDAPSNNLLLEEKPALRPQGPALNPSASQPESNRNDNRNDHRLAAPSPILNRDAIANLSHKIQKSNDKLITYDEKDRLMPGTVVLDGIYFSYNNKKRHLKPSDYLFSDLSLCIPATQKIGLVGLSGSGKSTLANLLMNLYPVNYGRILLDGEDLNNIDRLRLREYISFIQQEPILFSRTIRENIAYGRDKVEENEIIEASKGAHSHEFIKNLEERYETQIGENSQGISGGQKQRIAIARAMLNHNSRLLILDEPTSALDTETEHKIKDALKRLWKGKTVIIIAHRLATVKDLDRILVLHNGKIIEDGSHEVLMAKRGHYAMLWSMQSDGLLPE